VVFKPIDLSTLALRRRQIDLVPREFIVRVALPLKFWNTDTSTNPSPKSVKNPKIHKYSEAHNGTEFAIQPLKTQAGLYTMTSQRIGLKPSDYILIYGKFKKKLYKVLEIDYYDCGMPDMWIAKLGLVVK
jgi:hypothetical protein